MPEVISRSEVAPPSPPDGLFPYLTAQSQKLVDSPHAVRDVMADSREAVTNYYS